MRSILVHIHNDPCLESRLQIALDLARAFGGHLTCLQVTPYDFLVPGDLYGTLAAEMVPVLRKSAEELRQTLTTRLEREDVAWDWREEDGLALDFLLRLGALSDVVVVGAGDPATGDRSASRLAGDLAIRGRAAVLVVPESARALDVAGSAVIGWNGSAEAARAVKGALPLLMGASSVVLATVVEPQQSQDDISVVEAAEYLSRHGIGSEITELPRGDRSAAEVLGSAAAARKAAYLVIGAYGAPRLVESVFGGVTRELLAQPPLPILTCH